MKHCEAINSLRRSTTSPNAPAGTASSTIGSPAADWIKATSVAELVSVSISSCAPTVCI
jgi:hypothetical protein